MPTKRITQTPNTATLTARLNKSRKDKGDEIENEIKDIYKKIGFLAKQQGIYDKIINTPDNGDESEASFRTYQSAVVKRKSCIQNINDLREKIKKKRNSILKPLSVGGRGSRSRSSRRRSKRINRSF